ncbi:DUF3037 domain-containing protein [Rhizobium leguminosarum]|uniref:DUF3037 domain-containing protein n=1 Tax=Rhizobium leguminosarum TaxID=384 RepID=UPI001C929932|nr:DUF3037 domain-containing protein [Rhizobium leguminosarum]MBY2951865.1 DUF3037 domain-containing protein [Rhizobium leguminosarum]
MTSKQRYTYTVLRYVHDVVTGEFVNVGVLLYAPKSNLVKVAVRTSIGRIKHVFPDLDRQAFLSAVKAAERSVRKISKGLEQGDLLAEYGDAASIARKVLVADDSSLQWSSVSGGLTEDAEKTFDRVYRRYVSRYDAKSPHRRSDDEVWRPVRLLLEEKNVPVEFDEKILAGTSDEIVFKRAWRNGVWHAYEPLSFDLADAEGIKDKARRWRGHLEAVHDGLQSDLKLHFIVGAPQNHALLGAFQNAIKILSEAAFRPEIYQESEIPQLVSKIEDELREHATTHSPHAS